jgi:hypothetical protein
MRTAILLLALSVWPLWCAVAADQPFDVSVSAYRFVDLSPYYQQVVREATESYRGDFPDGYGHTILVQYYGGTGIHYFSQSELPQKIWTVPFLSVTLQPVPPNPAIQLTPSRTAFTFDHD